MATQKQPEMASTKKCRRKEACEGRKQGLPVEKGTESARELWKNWLVVQFKPKESASQPKKGTARRLVERPREREA